MSEVFFRRYKAEDKEAVYALHIAGLEETGVLIEGEAREELDKDFDDIEKTYIEPGGDFIVAVEHGIVVGMGALKKLDEKTAEVKRMRVQQNMRGRHIGSRILDQLIERARQQDYGKLVLDTNETQKEAHILYESRGFKEVRRGIYYGYETRWYELEI